VVFPANIGPMMTWTSPEGRPTVVMGIEGLQEAMELEGMREKKLGFLKNGI
jgi:hypothetical protein